MLLFQVVSIISGCLPIKICDEFLITQEISCRNFFEKEKSRLDSKLIWLLRKKEKLNLINIKPIKYHCLNESSSDILISPQVFSSHSSSSLNTLRKKWFVNLSSVDIPYNVMCFLQLGENFALPFNNRTKIVFECIKGIESSVLKMPITRRMDITNHSIPILNNIVSAPKFTSPTTKKLSELESHTVDFIKKHPNVIYTHADKGNVTVALDKDVYVSNMNSLFSDSNTYEIIKKDPTKKLTSSLRVMLTEWKNKDYIDGSEYRKLYCSDGMLPRAYGLPKIHKPDCPLRIIVSSIGSLLHSLASFLHEILFETIPVADSNIKNSFKLIEKLKCFNNADISIKHDANSYPSYYKVQQAKRDCYPLIQAIKITDTSAEINLQALLDLTVHRMSKVFNIKKHSETDKFILISKWGFDGASS
ncbi:hypothetical protein ALC62_16014 [Cyphomyrmex costatus]|uniref:Uncharacterized protein n=1 Tax=Cyphomyrmex costatus TaxID=456900 RepID=A0A151I674_9HYME|nr:hypothetical protein ALC62_16014 [Cyphomyrmex costatus]